MAVPALIALGGVDTALIATGAFFPVLLVLRIRALLQVDAAATVPVVEVTLLRSLPIFAGLPPGSLDGLARNSTLANVSAGVTVIHQGEIGERFYAIADGEVRVEIDGRFVRTMTRGEGFGEIALLRSVRRTATVTAVTAVTLLEIDKDVFIVELTGHTPSRSAADASMWTSILERAGLQRVGRPGSVLPDLTVHQVGRDERALAGPLSGTVVKRGNCEGSSLVGRGAGTGHDRGGVWPQRRLEQLR